MTETDRNIVSHLQKELRFNFIVTDPNEINAMYEIYKKQRKEQGGVPAEKGQVLFLDSSISTSDEGEDYPVSKCLDEALRVQCYVGKYDTSYADVALRLGFQNTLHIFPSRPPKTQTKDPMGK